MKPQAGDVWELQLGNGSIQKFYVYNVSKNKIISYWICNDLTNLDFPLAKDRMDITEWQSYVDDGELTKLNIDMDGSLIID